MGGLAFLFPGQGSQSPGMGADLFDDFPDLVAAADAVLGYPVRELCLSGDGRLNRTEYSQPALYVVNAMAYLRRRDRGGPRPDFLAGHSLGEYSALFAAGCFDFETGLRLVRRRGELMSRSTGGGMMAVLGVALDRLTALLDRAGIDGVDVANHNTPEQLVLAGPREATRAVSDLLAAEGIGRCVPLNVSIAAHSRYMEPAAREFAALLREVAFTEPSVPVVANVSARPHRVETMADHLTRHLTDPVRWWDTLCALAAAGVDEIEEIGPGEVLRKMWHKARPHLPPPAPVTAPVSPAPAPPVSVTPSGPPASATPSGLGDDDFRRDYRIRHAYLAGPLDHGVSGPEMLIRLADADLLGFLGTTGRSLSEVEDDLRALSGGAPGRFGVAIGTASAPPERVRALVDLALRYGVRYAEVSDIDVDAGDACAALVRWRFAGADRPRPLLATVSRAGRAAGFLRPAPAEVVRRLGASGVLTADQAQAAASEPLATDLCTHAEDSLPLLPALLPTVLARRDEAAARHPDPPRVRVGVAGVGDPAAVAAAFLVGADFVMTGSVNQCSPEARTSEAVKDILATLDVDDVAYAPAGDLFELGGRRPVVRRGTLFAARAEALYQIYRRYTGLDDIDERSRQTLAAVFGRPVEEVWAEAGGDRQEPDAKRRMALVFRSYFDRAARVALDGNPDERLNYRITCGPDMGSFNRFAAGGPLADRRGRHVDLIADSLMGGAAELLGRRLRQLVAPAQF